MQKLLSRQELQKLLTTDADAFTALRFLRHREQTPAIAEIEKSGESRLPGFAGSLCDLYHALWAETPAVREEAPAARRYWAEILRAAMASSAYGELHPQTQYSDLKSLLGTLTMGQSVLATVSKEDKDKLQEAAQRQQDADQAEAEAQQAEAEATAANALAEAAQQAVAGGQDSQEGDGQDGNGQPQTGAGGQPQSGGRPQDASVGQGGQPQTRSGMTLEEAQELVNQLAARAAEERAKATAAQQAVGSVVEEVMGKPGTDKAADKLRELTRVGIAAARKAQEQVQEVSDTIEAWGLEEGQLVRKGMPEALGVLARMQRSPALRKFAALLGRIKQIAARKSRSKERSEGVRVAVPETGRDIKRAVPSELVALTHPALRTKALMRWARGELRLRGEQAKKKLGNGPVVVCEDGSGSMDGQKRWWAKAVVLGLAHYAKLQRRSFVWVHFGSEHNEPLTRVCKGGRLTAENILEIAETFFDASGTDFERPLSSAIETIRAEGLTKADIAFVTDGECAVSEEFLRGFRTTKSHLEVNVFAVLCDVGSSSDESVRQFADRVERVSSFTDKSAEAVFNNL